MKYLVVYSRLNGPVSADVLYASTDVEAREKADRLPAMIAKLEEHAIPRHNILHVLKEEREGSNTFVEIS